SALDAWVSAIREALADEIPDYPGLRGWTCEAVRVEGLGASRDLGELFLASDLTLAPEWALFPEGDAVFFEEPESFPASTFLLTRHGPGRSAYWAGTAKAFSIDDALHQAAAGVTIWPSHDLPGRFRHPEDQISGATSASRISNGR
ncbi:MAG: hypothetical protein FJZ00_00760, partial [Candidatus Sericytochromatia bacterium]|nr:hypothetical protein [Candidatus Tanganyikabacteria bacterium]